VEISAGALLIRGKDYDRAAVIPLVSSPKGDRGVPPWSWVMLAATILALSSTAQAYRMTALGMRTPTTIRVGQLLVLNFTLWWVPAALSPAIFRLVEWLSSNGKSWLRSLGYHSVALLLFSVIHFIAFLLVRTWFWWLTGRLQSVRWLFQAQQIYLDNINWTLMTYGSIAAIGYAFNLRRRNHERSLQVAHLETQLVEARLGALAGELQPEFLYGALGTVASLVHVNPDRADRIISKLADFLRLVLNRTGTIVGPLQDELECVERYVEIEQMRLGAGLSVRLEIDPETLDAEFPPMALHNVVELFLEDQPERTATPPTALTIASSHSGGSLNLRITRDGETSHLAQGGYSRRARRLADIGERLRDLYGEKQDVGLNLDDRASAISIRVPFRTALS
jgi:hypothetical protein